MSRHDILGEIEEKVREQYFQDVKKLRYPESVLNGKNYLQVMQEKLHKYGYYDPVNKILDDAALLKYEGVAKEYFIDQRDRLMAEYNDLLQDVDEQIEQRIHQRIQQRKNNRKPAEKEILKLIINRPLTPMESKAQQKPEGEFYMWRIGTRTLNEWMNMFTELWNAKPKIKKDKDKQQKRIDEKNRRRIEHSGTVPYPFKSKIKAYEKKNPDVQYEQTVSDLGFDKKTLKNLKRPYYSKYPGCTRYLVVYPIAEQAARVQESIKNLMSRFKVTSIRGDGSTSYSKAATLKDSICSTNDLQRITSSPEHRGNPTINLMKMYQRENINIYFDGGKFTNHNRMVDVVIKTIRNAIGYRKLNKEQVQEIVDYYNFTPHRGLRLMGSSRNC